MLLGPDYTDDGALELMASDLELLELSINDLVIALGGKTTHTNLSYIEKVRSGKLFDCFSRNVRNERTFRSFKMFKGLDLQVDSFFRILKLHMDRGFSFLTKVGPKIECLKLFCLTYVDVVFDLYYGVVKQVTTFSLHDCVYIYKFFIKLDNSLLSYRIKNVYVRDEIYDLMLHSLWFALKDAWWLYLNPKYLKPLFPFISHMRVENSYEVTIHDLNHVLHNIHFVTLISQDMSFQSETATIVEKGSERGQEHSIKTGENTSLRYGEVSESDLEIKYLTSPGKFPNFDSSMSNVPNFMEEYFALDSETHNRVYTPPDIGEMIEIAKGFPDWEGSENNVYEPTWCQVIYVAFVGNLYILLFESYLNVVEESLNLQVKRSTQLEILVKRLQDLIQVNTLIVEVDCNFTAWAQDKLGNCSDAELLKCFETYSDVMFSDRPRETYSYNYKGEMPRNDPKLRIINTEKEISMYLLSQSLERAQTLEYQLIQRISSLCVLPIIKYIDNIYFLEESSLYYDILYNTEEYLIGPKGPLSNSCRMLPNKFKKAIFVEVYFRVVKRYIRKIMESDSDLCEAIIFDSLAIWDSILDYFDFSSNPQIVEDDCVKILANLLDQIKFTPQVDLTDLDSSLNKVKENLFKSPKKSESMLSVYSYNCLKYINPQGEGEKTNKPESEKTTSKREDAEDQPVNMERFTVWLNGVRKKRMLMFGNIILFFRDNSMLQPVGFLAFDSIYSILAPHTLAQVHPNVQILENNSENDSFSCGTSKSSRSADLRDSNEFNADFSNKNLYNTTLDNFNENVNNQLNTLEDLRVDGENIFRLVNNTETFEIRDKSEALNLSNKTSKHNTTKNQKLKSTDLLRSYPESEHFDSNMPKRGNLSVKTRYSTKSSRRSSIFDNLMVWGWQIRMELFDSCILEDFKYLDNVLDMEFTSPEYRKFWEEQFKDKPSANLQFISWPYHSLFFDSI